MQAWAPKTLSTLFWASVLVSAFAFFLSYPYQDSVALIFGSVVLVSVSLIRHYSAKPAITWQAYELGRQRWRNRKELGAALP